MVKKKYARLAAALAALIITGAGWMPAQAAYHEWSTDEKDRGNLTYEFTQDSGPSLSYAYRNIFIGDSWAVNYANDNFLFGDGKNQAWNLFYVDDSIVFGDNVSLMGTATNHITNAFVVGDDVSFNNVNTGTVIGNSNSILSVDDSMIIGNNVKITNNKDAGGKASGISVIGNDVKVRTAGDNITVIGDDVNVDTTGNRTNSSNSLIYGNNVTMTNSQNSVAMGNEISMTGTGNKNDDNVAIGHGISLGQSASNYSTGTVAMGDNIQVNGTDNVVIGGDIDLGSKALSDVVVLGHQADADGNQAVAIGDQATSGTFGVAVGPEANATENSVAIGGQAKANAGETTVVGPYSTVNSSYSAALGDHVTIGSNSIGSVSVGAQSAIGDNANYAIAIGGSGGGTGASAEERTVIGDGAKASIAMGYGATIKDYSIDSIALGTNANVDGLPASFASVTNATMSGIALGKNTNVQGQYSIAMGANSKVLGGYANAMESTAIGYSSSIDRASKAAVIGAENMIQQGANNSAILGTGSSIGTWSTNGLALGNKAIIGNSSKQSVAMGYMSSIGNNSSFSTALGGQEAVVNATGGTALGSYTQVDSNYSVAVGYGSKATTDDIFTEDELEAFKVQLGKEYDATYNITAADFSNRGVFSVGSEGGERRIINVARGRISADSTDAVNGSQLYGAVKYLEGKIDAAGGGGDVSIDGDDNITVTDTTPTTPGTGEGGGTTGGEGGTTGGGTTEPGGGPTGGAGSGSEGQNFTVNMSDNPQFGGHELDEEKGHSPDGSVSVVDSKGTAIDINKDTSGGISITDSEKNSIKINEGHSGAINVAYGDDKSININADKTGVINGLSNTEWDWGKYERGEYEGSTNAATESQLHELVGGIEQDITNMGDQITNLGGEVNRLSGRIDEVGAGAAALAALHPLDFDPDEKWDFAAGYGHYRGENAVAIGAFYRPNEDTMFSIGGTVGNGDEMINAGVSFKIGQGNHVSTSRVAMAKEIIELRKDLEDLRSAMAGGVTGQTLDLSKIQLFPDTPDNHWAYDYVATLAGNGILEGYPDGYFNGDRPITRYEMAAVLYRAMQKGVRLSDRALREFAPELDRIRVDTITKDEQGMPEIQRVRVVKGRE